MTPADPSQPEKGSLRRHAPEWLVLALACTAQFMVVLDVSIVNVALPAIRHSLGFSQAGLQWVLNAYTLTFAGFLLLGGRAADLFGRRRIFLIGLFVFTAASLLGGLAQNQAMLIGARAAQGLGGAILSPATLTILTTTFTEPKARARALGIWSAVAGAGGAAGALLGGILTDELSWRWILFINIPIGIVTLLVARLFLSETRSPSSERSLDLPGAVLVTGGLTALVYGLVRTTSVGWTSWQTIVALLLAVVLIGAFLFQEGLLARAPLMPLRLFAIRSLWSANLVMFMLSGAIFAMWFFVSLYLQLVLGYSALRTGFAFLPQTIAIVAGAQIASRAVLRIGPRPLLLMGTLCSAGGLFWLSYAGLHTAYWSGLFVASVLITLGLGLSFTPLALSATAGVAPSEAGLASGVINTSRQIGGAVGLAALATIATTRTNDIVTAARSAGKVSAGLRAALASGYTEAFAISAGVCLGAAAFTFFIPRRRTATAGAPRPVSPPAARNPAPVVD